MHLHHLEGVRPEEACMIRQRFEEQICVLRSRRPPFQDLFDSATVSNGRFFDIEDDVYRCAHCQWELEDPTRCEHCDLTFADRASTSEDEDSSDLSRRSEIDPMEDQYDVEDSFIDSRPMSEVSQHLSDELDELDELDDPNAQDSDSAEDLCLINRQSHLPRRIISISSDESD
ncbi:hypothetical protein MRB53_041880 [Persea americana]|nr:hypothetical protein MRB53_041880 [Persea americana]